MKSTDLKDKDKNQLDKYTSNVKHILIPLPNFKRYHQTESETMSDDDGFIGRRAIISKLKSWLANKETLTGAYLVTGFRGMGKSSFVGKALNELTQHHRYIKESHFQIIKGILLTFTFLTCVLNIMQVFKEKYFFNLIVLNIIAMLLCGGILTWLHRRKQWEYLHLIDEKRKVNNGMINTEYIPVRVNVGNELLAKNDEIMRLIIKSVYDTFLDYTKRPTKHLLFSYIVLCLQLLFICIVTMNLHFIKISYLDYKDINGILKGINGGFKFLITNYPYFFAILCCFLLYFLSIYIIEKIGLIIDHVHFLGITTFSGIKEQMHDLYLRSIAAIDEDYSSGIKYIPTFFSKKKYEKASVREMEQSLIAIFERLRNMSNSILHFDIRFIIVLDGLDKVETSIREDILHKDEQDELPSYETSVNGFSGTLNARKRRQEMMKTLANMKYFLSTVKAKFIFIAGRELYDAYLADVSDREFAISSVFDGVINVNSFFKPGIFSMDITGMTEAYICNRLMPENEKEKEKEECNLMQYYKYLNRINPAKESRNARNVLFLYQYILYLSHLSNGSPKKIAVYFEKDIRTRDYLTTIKKYILEEKDCQYYLSFSVKDIQKIGFMHYISYPIMQAMVSKSKIYEDKLLVSTSFMINHLYKYHNTGFSWRNLEHIPELLDMNKTPELRDFLGTIIAFLRQTHLSPIQSGLYLFKFPMKISEEISFLAKRIEDISALFHFSKDESLPVKKHYMRLLTYYTEKRNQITGEELHTLASIHHILADIYQADEDYSQAIYEYQTGLQLLSKQLTDTDYDKDAHWVSSMLFLIRNMLKLGIAYEKRKTFDSAYIAYSELEKKLIDYRELNEHKLKLNYNFEWDDSIIGKNAVLYQNDKTDIDKKAKEEQFLVQEWIDDPCYKYAFQANHIGYEFSRILSPAKFAILMRQSFFYDLRLAYLPTLAKLFVLEKMDTEGITRNNIDLAEAEFFYLHVFVDDSDKAMIYADFFQKLGDILYYKNGLIEECHNNLFQAVSLNGFDLKGLTDRLCKLFQSKHINTYYNNRRKIGQLFMQPNEEIGLTSCHQVENVANKICKAVNDFSLINEIKGHLFELQFNVYSDERLQKCIEHRKDLLMSGKRLPCYACKYYNMSLDSILNQILHLQIDKSKSKSINIMVWLLENSSRIKGYKETYLLLMGNTVKGLANVMLSCADAKDVIRTEFLTKLLDSFEVFYGKKKKEDVTLFCTGEKELMTLEKSLLLYMEAAMFFDVAGNKNNAAQMFRQILEVLNFYLRICRSISDDNRKSIIKSHLSDIEKVVQYVIVLLYGYCDGVNILEIDKFKSLYGRDIDENILFHQTPFSPDIEELLYRYYSLRIRCGEDDCIKRIYGSNMMGWYKQISTLSQDIQNLRFKFLLNECIFEKILNIRRMPENMPEKDFLEKTYTYFIQNEHVFSILEQNGIIVEDKSFLGKVDVLNFFIVDNLACLSKISNTLQPLNNPTLFTSYFLGDINLYTEFWRRIYDGLYLLYKDADTYSETSNYDNKKQTKDITNKEYDFIRQNTYYQHLCRYIATHRNGVNLAQKLKDYMKEKVEDISLERLSWNYNAELAIQNYSRAIEMHTEGRTYKEMIATLFFLDDDLNNDTLQQQMAIERYLINSNNIEHRMEQMKARLSKSKIYDINKYIN